MKGFFITVEGIDGCGKSTQLKLLAGHLKSLGYPVLVTKDPGGTQAGEAIRRLLLAKKEKVEVIDAVAETFLYLASRRALVSSVIKPGLAGGRFVICDRFTDSTLAYQGFGRGLSLPELRRICAAASDGLKPNLTFLLDIEPKTALVRTRGEDRIEALGPAFQKKVRRGYLQLAKGEPARIKVISAAGSPKEVFARLLPYLESFLPPCGGGKVGG